MSKLNPQKWGVFMIGYSISVYEFVEGMDITSISNHNEALATWTSGGFDGLDWIDNLVSEGKAEDLGGNGYPDYYKVQVQFECYDIRLAIQNRYFRNSKVKT
jgi:hypothetical protein